MQMMQLPGLTDPDQEDIASFVSADFGLAANFVKGKFPTYKIQPKSNLTDPGDYEVKIMLTDDNPNRQTATYTFKITVIPLPPPVVKIVKEIVISKISKLTAVIKSISSSGKVVVSFSHNLIIPANISQIDD
jgi:hypothetical protein